MHRRELLAALLGQLLRPQGRGWGDWAKDLRAGRITAPQWQTAMERALGEVSVAELKRAIGFDRRMQGLVLPDDRAATVDVPADGPFVARVFALAKGRAIVPHAHHRMASVHVVLSGRFRVRHYERVSEAPGSVLLRPTVDRIATPGDRSSVSDERDNVHWFVALDGPSCTLDLIVPGLGGKTVIDFVDPLGATHRGPDLLEAPRLTPMEAFRRYGKDG